MVQLIELFSVYVRWRILSHFLSHPTTSFYVKELARTLGVSPGSVSAAVESFREWSLVVKEVKGQIHLYKLNPEHCLIPPLKRAYGLATVLSSKPVEKLLKIDENILSIALYGSFADGSFDERSDIDILVITNSPKERFVDAARALEEELARDLRMSLFRISDWQSLEKNNDAFYRNVIQNNVLLYGSSLI